MHTWPTAPLPNRTSSVVNASPAGQPLLVVKEDEVCVFNAIHLKDKLKALGFRFIAAQNARSKFCCCSPPQFSVSS